MSLRQCSVDKDNITKGKLDIVKINNTIMGNVFTNPDPNVKTYRVTNMVQGQDTIVVTDDIYNVIEQIVDGNGGAPQDIAVVSLPNGKSFYGVYSIFTGELSVTVFNTNINATSISAFVIDLTSNNLSTLTAADFTVSGDWEMVFKPNKWVLFMHKPNGGTLSPSDTFNDMVVATLNQGNGHPNIAEGLPIYTTITTDEVNEINKNAAAAADMFTGANITEYELYVVRTSIAADPHIYPLINPNEMLYYLPADNKVYVYADSGRMALHHVADAWERMVITCKMWILRSEWIMYAQHVARAKSARRGSAWRRAEQNRTYEQIQRAITSHPLNTPGKNDMSFARYLCVRYMTGTGDTIEYSEQVIVDMETLCEVQVPSYIPAFMRDHCADRFSLKPCEDEAKAQRKRRFIFLTPTSHHSSRIHYRHGDSDGIVYPKERSLNTRMRKLSMHGRARGHVHLDLIIDPDYANDRNQMMLTISPVLLERGGFDDVMCRWRGVLVDLERFRPVRSLWSTAEDVESSNNTNPWHKREQLMTLPEFRKWLDRQWQLFKEDHTRIGREIRSALEM